MDKGFEKNEVLEKLPSHLLDFVIDQPYNGYTAQDHAVWRYVMRQNVNFLGKVAHSSYIEGLKKTGISIDSIPHMYGMNRILRDIGWAAVAVDGFIPPQAFMEFQAYKVLVIAADIRNIGHIQYTPAPDIIHEAAGHAPIIADEEYALYLKRFGEIGSKAFSSKKDYELYEAIRHLSIIKENPNTDQKDIDLAEEHINWLQNNMGEPSEMSLIRNLHWWTVEYGLIGTTDDYKLYGAGLLSSIGESANCMTDAVKKLPFGIAAANYSLDITTQQPQLFVTPSFEHLNAVLDEFAETMAVRTGGKSALEKAICSGAVATLVFDSFELTGVVTNGELSSNKAKLSFENRIGIFRGEDTLYLEPENVEGSVEVIVTEQNLGDEFSHRGEDYILDKDLSNGGLGIVQYTAGSSRLLVLSGGAELVSAYAGPANPKAWNLHFDPPKEKTQKILYNDQAKKLHALYAEVRAIREDKHDSTRLLEIFKILKSDYPLDWLLCLEIYEILNARSLHNDVQLQIVEHLSNLKKVNKEYSQLVGDGLKLIASDFSLIH